MLERYNIVPIPVFTAPIPVLFTGIGAVSLRSLLSRSVTGPLPFRSFWTDTVPVLYRSDTAPSYRPAKTAAAYSTVVECTPRDQEFMESCTTGSRAFFLLLSLYFSIDISL